MDKQNDHQDDEYRGQGGSYVIGKDGKRTRVETTADHPEGHRAREAEKPAATPSSAASDKTNKRGA